jgi:O-antigen/teichoic acid export membrane protein
MRSRKALLNIASSLSLQIVGVICGLITPRLIIGTFGSSVNGVIASISQFLGYIVLLEAGVGGVIRAALYKPLATNDTAKISGIVKATEKFFRLIALIFIGYCLIIACLFPYLVNNLFDQIFTFTLVLIIGASTFIQYYFGVSYQILLQADQKGYITASLQIFITIINTLLVVILIKLGAGIHIVKLGSTAIFIFRPVLLHFYVTKKYKIDKKYPPDNNAIKQRWDGLGHHIAFFLHTNTDIVVLTLLTNVKEVSVYSVYLMVVSGIEKLTTTFSTGLEAAFGNMIAKNEKTYLSRAFLGDKSANKISAVQILKRYSIENIMIEITSNTYKANLTALLRPLNVSTITIIVFAMIKMSMKSENILSDIFSSPSS